MKNIYQRSISIMLCLTLMIGAFPTIYAEASGSENDSISELVSGIVAVETDCIYPIYQTNNINAPKQLASPAKLLPSRYDTRKEGYTTSVKNQGKNGLCWAFASIAALEASMVKDGVSDNSVDLSESHMAHATCSSGGNSTQGFREKFSDGGNRNYAAAYLMRGTDGLFGAVAESDDPYSMVALQERVLRMTQEKPESYTVQSIVYITGEGKAIGQIDAIKWAVIDHGAVTASMYYKDDCYNNVTYAYYHTEGSEEVNHEVVIVGWDDAYCRENFKADPGCDGAWLVRNSWGEIWGDRGYCWISYADAAFPQYCTYYDGVKPYDDSLIVYETDYKCSGSGSGYTGGSMYCARVFQAESDEFLQSVRVFAPVSNAEISVDCIPNFQYSDSEYRGWYQFDGYDDFSVKASIYVSYPGWYTIDLDAPVALTQGKNFAVIIHVENDDLGSSVYLGTDTSNGLGNALAFISSGGNFDKYHDWSKTRTNFAVKAVTQKMLVRPFVALDTSKEYYIESALGNILDVEGISRATGANVYTWTIHGGDSQRWIFEDAGGGYYFIKSGIGTYLDVSDSSEGSGTNVLMWTLHRGESQKWALELADDGYCYIKSALGTYLDVDGAGTACGTNVWAYAGNRTAAQKWKLVS